MHRRSQRQAAVSLRPYLRSQALVPNVFENALALWLWRPAHGSIRVHEGDPNPTYSDGTHSLPAKPYPEREIADIRMNLMGPIAVAI